VTSNLPFLFTNDDEIENESVDHRHYPVESLENPENHEESLVVVAVVVDFQKHPHPDHSEREVHRH